VVHCIRPQIIALQPVSLQTNLALQGPKHPTGFGAATVLIRAEHDYDWLKLMRHIDPTTKEERCGDRVYYLSHPKPGKEGILSEMPISPKVTFGYVIPDKRTLVFLPSPSVLRAFRNAETKERPHFWWDKEWKHVEKSLIAWAADNRSGRCVRNKQLGNDPFPEWTALTQNTSTMVAGVDWKDGIDIQAYLAYKEPAAADQAVRDLKSFLKQSRRDLVQDASDVPEPEERRAMVLQVDLCDHVRIRRKESTVCVHSNAKFKIADVVKMFQPVAIQEKKP
jgi:hypothetical protein